MEYEPPKPGPQHEKLQALAGNWAGPEVMLPSPFNPERSERHGKITSRMLDGFFLISDYEQSMGDAVHFRGHGVYSYDPQADEYAMYWFDSMGGGGQKATGNWEGNQLIFQSVSPMGHHRYRYTLDGDSLTFDMAMSQSGDDWNMFMEASYKREA